MSISESVSFDCPNCGSAVHPLRDGNTSMDCPACGRAIIIPPDYRYPLQAEERAAPANHAVSDQQKRILRELMLILGMGKKTDAVRRYREAFGVTLAEAQVQIDRLEKGEGIDLPEPVLAAHSVSVPPVVYPNPDVRIPPARVGRQTTSAPKFLLIALLLAAGVIAFAGFAAVKFLNQMSPAKVPGEVASIATQAASGSLFKGAPTLLDPAALIAVSDQPADLIIQARRFDQDPYTTTIVRYSGANGALLWESTPFSGKDVYIDQIINDASQTYVVIDDQVFAFQLSDGKPAWNAKLTDKLGYCGGGPGCTVIQEQVLLVQSTDDMLQAFDTTSGSQLWQHRVYYPSQGIHLFKNQVVIYDQDAQSKKTAIAFLNLTSGQEELRVSPADLYGSPDILLSQSTLYLIGTSAIEKWDISGAAPVLSGQIQGDFYIRGNQRALGADVLFISGDHAVLAINLADGASKDLIADADYDLQPLTISGSQLLVLAKRTRGTAKYEFWNVDNRTGEKTVIDSFGESQLISDSSPSAESQDKYIWTWKLNGTSLTILKFKASPNQVTIDSYDINTGKKLKSAAVGLDKVKDDSYSIRSMIGWQGHTLWVMLDSEVYGIDTQSGKIVSSIP